MRKSINPQIPMLKNFLHLHITKCSEYLNIPLKSKTLNATTKSFAFQMQVMGTISSSRVRPHIHLMEEKCRCFNLRLIVGAQVSHVFSQGSQKNRCS